MQRDLYRSCYRLRYIQVSFSRIYTDLTDLDENVRSPAIRLVTNILYSCREDPISLAIDKYANDMLHSLVQLGQEGNDEALDQSTICRYSYEPIFR